MALKEEDERDIIRYNLKLEHTTHDGSEIYSAPVEHEKEGDHLTNKYFYRAMSLKELDSYRIKFFFDRIKVGHQGWAPYRKYSYDYMNAEITRLVEVYAPDFVASLKKEGWFIGKNEKGCMSWGIGETQSNGWRKDEGVTAKNKNEANDPCNIFHDTLKSVRVVNVFAVPVRKR